MRHYIYIDKNLLKSIYSSFENEGFSLEAIEYSIKRVCGKSNNFEYEPEFENSSETECEFDIKNLDIGGKDVKKIKSPKSRRERTRNSTRNEIKFNNINSEEAFYEKRYTNIEDVSEVRNLRFLHNLVENIRQNRRIEDRIYCGKGPIYPCKLKDCYNSDYRGGKSSLFLKQEDNYIWLDQNILLEDIFAMSNFVLDVGVVGYVIRNEEFEDFKITKAIAIYI